MGTKKDSAFCKTQEYVWLVQKLTGKTRTELLSQPTKLTQNQQKQLDLWAHEIRVLHKPIQYILGTVPFCGLDICVEPPVLIPRPETEEWVSTLIQELKKTTNKKLVICDMCTGSGCIALALASSLKNSSVTGVDIAQHALTLAQKNQELLALKNVNFVQSNLFKQIQKKFDIIVSNPPYVSYQEWEKLALNIRNWEDAHALVAPENGCALLEKIIKDAREYFVLKTSVLLVLEIGCTQAKTVCTLLTRYGYTDIKIERDFADKDRVIRARYWRDKS